MLEQNLPSAKKTVHYVMKRQILILFALEICISWKPQLLVHTHTPQKHYEWHRVLGHMNFDDILKLQNVCNGMTITKTDQIVCLTCDRNKMSIQPKTKDIPIVKATYPLERVHSDVCGPVTPTSQEGYK